MKSFKVTIAALFVAVVVSGVFAIAPTRAAAVTIEELQAQVTQLLAVIAQLQGTTATGGGGYQWGSTRPLNRCPIINADLRMGQNDATTGGQVSELQQFFTSHYNLNPQELSGGYFGPVTQGYVSRFQREEGIATGVGNAGPLTRARIAQRCGQQQPSGLLTATPTSGVAPLTVSINPASAGSMSVNYGDGTSCTQANPGGNNCSVYQHTYTQPGVYTIVAYRSMPSSELGRATITVRAPNALDPAANSLVVTAPNGGERWDMGVMNSVTWTPYGYNPDVNPSKDVTAYLEKSNGRGGFTTLGKVQEQGKASIHWFTGELDSLRGSGSNVAEGSGYYIRVVNNVTGATDRSDAPFTILPRPVDVKVNGSDDPVTISSVDTPLTVSWTTTPGASGCKLSGLRDVSFSTIQPSRGTITGRLAYSLDSTGRAIAYASPRVECTKVNSTGASAQVWDAVSLIVNNVPTQNASLQITSPNGGEMIDSSSETVIRWKQAGLQSPSIALYRNDQWQRWISNGSVNLDQARNGANNEYSLSAQLTGVPNDGAVYKIYITGQKVDGSGYVDDKSDAPFGFAGAVTGSTASIDQSSLSVATEKDAIRPTITGTANGVTLLMVVASDTNGRQAGSAYVPVTNGRWSAELSPALLNGRYSISVIGNGRTLTTGTLSVSANPLTPTVVASPTGSISASGCAAGIGSTCGASATWSVQNSYYTPGVPFSVVNVIDNATGQFVGGSAVSGRSYYQVTTSQNGAYTFSLPKGSYTFVLYGWANNAHVLLGQRSVSVTEQADVAEPYEDRSAGGGSAMAPSSSVAQMASILQALQSLVGKLR